MNNKLALALFVATLAAQVSPAQGQEKRNAVSLSGSLSNAKTSPSSGSSTTDLIINVGYERLVTDQISALVNVTLDTQSSDGVKSGSQAIEGGAAYYFGTPMKPGKILPYGKGLLRYVRTQSGGSTDNGAGIGAFVGLEHTLTEGASLFDEIGYQRDKYKFNTGNVTVKQVVLRFGLKYRF